MRALKDDINNRTILQFNRKELFSFQRRFIIACFLRMAASVAISKGSYSSDTGGQ